MFKLTLSVIAAFSTLAATQAMAGPVLDAVKARGQLLCGVSAGLVGFMHADSQGVWRGLSVDMCRATAAALFGDASKVKYIPLEPQKRFPALEAGEVDLLASNSTATLGRDAGADFVAIYYYDGQGFMVPRKLGRRVMRDLDGAKVCVQPGTTTEANVADYFRLNKMSFTPVLLDKIDDLRTAFFAGRCDVLTADVSNLYATRAAYAPNPSDYTILPRAITKEPLGLAVRHGDNQFGDIVRWSLYAMIEAEEYGITSRNVDEALKSENPTLRRILGTAPGMGKALGVDEKWAYNIVKQVGNYGEVFDRNLGPNTVLKIPRGMNTPWRDGGMLYAPPIR
jgi:general L-amino acid transport system substrate-binding protein